MFFDINALNSCEAVWNCPPHARESRMVLDSGFHAVDSVFKLLHSSVLSVGFWIPILSEIPDSLSCTPDQSRYSVPVFVSRILDSNR